MIDNIREIAAANAKNTGSQPYYKAQFRVWTRFDPTNTELIEIARAVDDGAALLSAIEITRVASGVAEIDDPDVREQFETVAAAERILGKVSELPEALRDRLQHALAAQHGPEQLAG